MGAVEPSLRRPSAAAIGVMSSCAKSSMAVMYILSTGCQWRAIANWLPPRSTLYDYFDLWGWDGTLDRIHDGGRLYAQCRQAAAREASPTAAIIDSQSVKSAEKGACD